MYTYVYILVVLQELRDRIASDKLDSDVSIIYISYICIHMYIYELYYRSCETGGYPVVPEIVTSRISSF